MCTQVLNAYLGYKGMLKTPAPVILKWVLSVALLKSMNYEKTKEGPRRNVPPSKKKKNPKLLNSFGIKIIYHLI